MVEESEKPQQRDQSKRVLWQNSNNWTTVFSSSSKARRFHSNQIVHIKQPGTKSHISELCFPSQWNQQNNKSSTEPGMTQSIPNNRSIYIHKEWAIGQKSNKWSTDSTLTSNTTMNMQVEFNLLHYFCNRASCGYSFTSCSEKRLGTVC